LLRLLVNPLISSVLSRAIQIPPGTTLEDYEKGQEYKGGSPELEDPELNGELEIMII
jgi:hypothetical protein